MDDINKKIKTIIDSNNIVLFMKGTPEVPQCGFSLAVSGMTSPLAVVSSDSPGRTTIRSSRGCKFIFSYSSHAQKFPM